MEIKINAQVKVYLLKAYSQKGGGLRQLNSADVYGTKKRALEVLASLAPQGKQSGQSFNAGAMGTGYVNFEETDTEEGYQWKVSVDYPDISYSEEFIVLEKTL